jgi:hypothetical protein
MRGGTMRYRIVLKILEIVLSTVFLLLCVEAFCSHFYNHLRLVLRLAADCANAEVAFRAG